MAYLIGGVIGAIIATFILSRIVRWALKFMGDTNNRVLATAAVSYVLAVTLAGFGNANGGPWNPGSSLFLYGIGVAVWGAMDWLGLKGRQSKPRPVSTPSAPE